MELNRNDLVDLTYQVAAYNFAFATIRQRLSMVLGAKELKHIALVETRSDFKNHEMVMAVALKNGGEYSTRVLLGLHVMQKTVDEHLSGIWGHVIEILRENTKGERQHD